MREAIYSALAPVRYRQQLQRTLSGTAWGLCAGALLLVALGCARLAGWIELTPNVAAALFLAGPGLGALIGALWPNSWLTAARAVDTHYTLKDRTSTALAFVAVPARTELQNLQVTDALEHLHKMEPNAVVPLRVPHALRRAALAAPVLVVLAAIALLVPLSTPIADAKAPEPNAKIVAEADRLQETLQDLEDAIKEDKDEQTEKLLEQLKAKVEELKQPGVDEKEALAKLSEMQTAIQAVQKEFNAAVIDGQMQSIGQALAAASALQGAGKALQEAKYDKALKELDKLNDQEMSLKEAKAVEDKLKQVAKESEAAGLGSLSAAVSDLAENLKGGKGKLGQAFKGLAKEVAAQAKRKKLNEILTRELDDLNESKCNCEANSLVTGKKPRKSKSPSSSWGMTSSGNIDGEKTKLPSQRNQVNITGEPGDGPSDTETITSPEARERASRAVKDKHQQYQKLAEDALDSEPIPLGQRQMIRKYFELIRPTNAETPEKK
jgi:hypothetical protein